MVPETGGTSDSWSRELGRWMEEDVVHNHANSNQDQLDSLVSLDHV